VEESKITYEAKKGKYVFCKDGVYFSLDSAQVLDLCELLAEILLKEQIAKL
jgi:hypothetical protein